MKKHHAPDDLAERLELEEKRQSMKAQLLEHNPLLHPHPLTADNENQPVAGILEATKETPTVMGEATGCASALVENMQRFQDVFGDLFATQRRVAELWMETWLSMFSLPMLYFGMPLTEKEKEDRQATQASALVMGA